MTSRARRWRPQGSVLAAAAVAVTSAAILGAVTGGGPPAGTANLWVDTSGGTCTRQAVAAAYNDAAACSSFDAANDVCQNGDTVLVKTGAYSAQDLTGSNSRTSACTMQADSGATVTVVALTDETGADWLTFRNMADHSGDTIEGSTTSCVDLDQSVCVSGSHVTLDGFDVSGPYAQVNIDGCTGCLIENSDFGTPGNTTSIGCPANGDPQPMGAPWTMANDINVTVAHVDFWQFEGQIAVCGTHLEDVRIWDSSDGVTFLDNVFHGGGADTAYVSSSQGGCTPPTCPQNVNVHFYGNAFLPRDPGLQSADVLYGDNNTCNGFEFAYNFFTIGINNQCVVSESNSKFVGNEAPNATGACIVGGTGAVNTGNVFIGSTSGCAGNTFLGGTTSDFTPFQLAGDGYHLTATSPAINAGENTLCTADLSNLDIDGRARSGVCDAGPDEYGN